MVIKKNVYLIEQRAPGFASGISAKCADGRRRADGFVAELPFAGRTVDDRHGGRVINAEFAFEAGFRGLDRGDLHDPGMNRNLDPLDHIGCEVVSVSQLNAAVDHWMNHKTARERLVAVFQNLPALAVESRMVALAVQHVEPAEMGFEAVLRRGEIFAGEKRRRKPVLRRPSRMEALGHRIKQL